LRTRTGLFFLSALGIAAVFLLYFRHRDSECRRRGYPLRNSGSQISRDKDWEFGCIGIKGKIIGLPFFNMTLVSRDSTRIKAGAG
jgi:hypothetical protein